MNLFSAAGSDHDPMSPIKAAVYNEVVAIRRWYAPEHRSLSDVPDDLAVVIQFPRRAISRPRWVEVENRTLARP